MEQAVSTTIPPAVLSTEQAGQYLNLAPSTLTTWRCTHEVALPFVRLGRRIVYRRADLDRFLAEHVEGAPA
jgi:excisionase family DNA binding protein